VKPSLTGEEIVPPLKKARSEGRLSLVGLAWFGVLLLLCYAPVLGQLVSDWYNDEDMGHGFFVPVAAGYIIWQRRKQWLDQEFSTSVWGLVVVALGALQLIVATLGLELFLARTAFLVSLAGAVLYLGGPRLLKLFLFPLFLLCFMIPIPAIVYNQITLPLQLFASRVAEFVLSTIGIPVLREGNILELSSQKLSVVEACSGIRSLLSLSFLALVYSYILDPKPWMRVALLVATVPIAIVANAARVTVTGIVSEWNPALAQNVFHLVEGWVVFLVAVMIMVGAHQFFNKVYERMHAGR